MGCADSNPNIPQTQFPILETNPQNQTHHTHKEPIDKLNIRESKKEDFHQEQLKISKNKKRADQSEQIKSYEEIPLKIANILPQPQSKSAISPQQSKQQLGKSRYTKDQLHVPNSSESEILQFFKSDPQALTILSKAQELLKNKQYEPASKQFKKIKTEHCYLLNSIAYCQYQQSNYDKAIQYYGKSLKLNDKHAPTYFRLGRTFYYKQLYQKAIQQYQACLLLDPSNSQIYYQLGLCDYYLENYKKSIEYFLKCLKIDSNHIDAMFSLAKCYFYLQNYKSSIQWCKKIILKQPTNSNANSYIGYCYYQMADYQKSISFYETSIKLNDKQPLTYYRMGLAYYWKQEYDKSIEFYQTAINLNPKNDFYYIGIGNSVRYQEQYQTAIEWYKKALELNSNNKEAYWRMGIAYYYEQDYKKAKQCYKKAIKVDENYSNPYVSMGDCFFYDQDYVNAIKYYLEGIGKKYNHLNYCNFMIAKCYYFNEEGQKAIPYFQKAIQLYPKHIIYHVYYGRCLLQIQNFAESYKIFTKAKQLYENAKDIEQYSQSDYLKSEINDFIKSAAEWQEKKKIGYISPDDKLQIKKMRGNFEKKYKAIFGVECADEKQIKAKPLDQLFLGVVNLIHQDEFTLDISKKNQSTIVKIASIVRNMFNYDQGSFQIFAYLLQEFMWLKKFQQKIDVTRIELMLNQVLSLLSQNYPSTAKTSASTDKPVEFPFYKQIKYNLFTEISFFQSYDIVVLQIQKINQRAKNDLQPFKEFVYTIEKNFKGNHAKVGMKLPEKPEKGTDSDREQYQQKLFKVLIRILQKMFKQLSNQKQGMLNKIDSLVPSSKKIPLYSINQIIMSTWIQQINNILVDRKQNNKVTECYITDLVRGKCMFQSVDDIKEAVNGVIELCKAKGYQIIELDNRLLKVTQDIVFKIKIKQVVSQFQMALQFDLVSFDFGHNFYQIQRCPLGCIFGSSLFLTKDVSESFLQKISNSIKGVKAMKPEDKQTLKSLNFVLDSFKTSCKKRHHIF